MAAPGMPSSRAGGRGAPGVPPPGVPGIGAAAMSTTCVRPAYSDPGRLYNPTFAQPNVTVWDGSTEAPDETARGDWMKLVATAGLQWDKAVLEYLVQGRHEVERTITPFWRGVGLTMNRPRPPKPPKSDEEKSTTEPAR